MGVAGTVHDGKDFFGIRQRNQQRMVSPTPFVIDVHTLFALARGVDQDAIGIDLRFVEKGIILLLPDIQSSFVNRPHQRHDISLSEPSAKVSRGSGIRN